MITHPTVTAVMQNLRVAVAYAMADVCRLDLAIRPIKERVFRRADELIRASTQPTAELILALYGPGGWWYSNDWRGKRGDRPTLENILETWAAAVDHHTRNDDRRKYVGGQYSEFIEH